jgi:threonine/homoserine/homoserine lactone efflux protein
MCSIPRWRCSSSPSCRNSWQRTPPHKPLAFLLLGGIFIFNSTLWCLGIAAFAARAASSIRRSEGVMVWINRVLGGMFVYLGFRVAMLEAR